MINVSAEQICPDTPQPETLFFLFFSFLLLESLFTGLLLTAQ